MKKKSVKGKILTVSILVISITLLVVAITGSYISKSIITKENDKYMESELCNNQNKIQSFMNTVSSAAVSLSDSVAGSYKKVSLEEYEVMLGTIASENDAVLGCGIWFAPNVYNSEKYVGPYVYKDGGALKTTYEYSNAEYDYFNQEYYTKAAGTKDSFIVTNPYYDETSDIVMATTAAPMYDADNKFIGCVTVDIQLSDIQNLISDIKIGDSGDAILLDSTGTFIGAKDESKVNSSANITEDKSLGLATKSNQILDKTSGDFIYKVNKTKYNMHYTTLESTGWKLITRIKSSELEAPILKMFLILMAISITALVFVSIIIYRKVNKVSKVLRKASGQLHLLADGDLQLEVDAKLLKDDTEIGEIANSLITVRDHLISIVSEIRSSSDKLYDTSTKFNSKFAHISESVSNVNNAIEEIAEGSTSQAQETQRASESEITMGTAIESSVSSIKCLEQSVRNMTNVSGKLNGVLQELSVINTKTSGNIGLVSQQTHETNDSAKKIEEAVALIQDIAAQTNLLSLNASIEAARAGEAGAGFTVVAEEIRVLSECSSKSASEIDGIVKELIANSNSAVHKMQEVSKDAVLEHDKLQQSINQFGELNSEVSSVEQATNQILQQTKALEEARNEVAGVIEQLAAISQEDAASTEETSASMQVLLGSIEECQNETETLAELSTNLKTDTNRFKL